MKLVMLVAATAITANVINGPDAELEPSVINEVEHALNRARNCEIGKVCPANVFGTNGLTRTATAVKLVSSQGADGTWMVHGTNFTAEAVNILIHAGGIALSPDFSIILGESDKKDKR